MYQALIQLAVGRVGWRSTQIFLIFRSSSDMKILTRFTALLLSEGRLNIMSFRDLRLHEKRELIYIEEGKVLPVVSDADTTGVPT